MGGAAGGEGRRRAPLPERRPRAERRRWNGAAAVSVAIRSAGVLAALERGCPPVKARGDSKPWTCSICTFKHDGDKVRFRACEVCGQLREGGL